jgi:hypothetical protein
MADAEIAGNCATSVSTAGGEVASDEISANTMPAVKVVRNKINGPGWRTSMTKEESAQDQKAEGGIREKINSAPSAMTRGRVADICDVHTNCSAKTGWRTDLSLYLILPLSNSRIRLPEFLLMAIWKEIGNWISGVISWWFLLRDVLSVSHRFMLPSPSSAPRRVWWYWPFARRIPVRQCFCSAALSARSADRRNASREETVGRVFANFQYPAKEKRRQFQNRWNWISIRFCFTRFKGAQFN